jgi:ubiquinone/menaquinone biosynthesis C-methylase UbiE
MDTSASFSSALRNPVSAGGFLNPDKIVFEFNIRQGMSVADFGCGSGYFTILAAQKVGSDGKVYALDVQESSLDSVRTKAKAAGVSNIETIRANLEVLGSSGLGDESQDMVLIANVLFQSPKKENIFQEAHRVLKKDAQLVVVDWVKGSGGFGPPDNLRTDDIAMEALVASAGFTFIKKIDAGKFHYGLIFKKQ